MEFLTDNGPTLLYLQFLEHELMVLSFCVRVCIDIETFILSKLAISFSGKLTLLSFRMNNHSKKVLEHQLRSERIAAYFVDLPEGEIACD